MTEKEVIEFLEDEINGLEEQKGGVLGDIGVEVFKEINGEERLEIFKTIMKFIIELQQYRKIGTVEECREAVKKQKTTDSL